MRYLGVVFLAIGLAACQPQPLPADVKLPDGAVYDGDIQDNLFHGEGVLIWPDERRYEGEFREGLMTGQGRLELRDGCIMEGTFVEGVLHGEGSLVCGDDRYQGTFRQGELVSGSVTYVDGNSYQGEFQAFLAHGEGIWVTPSGEQYEGTFADGSITTGSYRNQEGYAYNGPFQGFDFHGKGELTRPDGVIIRAGFEYGKASGPGVRILPAEGDGKPVVENGYFVKGKYYLSEKAYLQSRQQQAAGMEARLYTESSRLQSALSSLAPQRPGVRDVYFLAVGGDGTEGVFDREVTWVSAKLGSVLDLKRRQILLVNGGSDELPLATRTSVQESLKALDALMDPAEDLLLVHFVSHGAMNGELVLDTHNLQLNNLSVDDGKSWFNSLAVKHQWVVVSACYSGHWVEALAAPDRVVFSSAATDRTSFGCGDDSERTWFSKALYGEGMSAGINDPDAWFSAAQAKVSRMEDDQGFEEHERSLPQKAVGNNFLRWWQSNDTAVLIKP